MEIIMNKTLKTLESITQKALTEARHNNNPELYNDYDRVKKFVESLIALEDLALRSRFSEVNFTLTCSGNQEGDCVDYVVEGTDEWGNKEHVTSDANLESLTEAIIDIADSTAGERKNQETE